MAIKLSDDRKRTEIQYENFMNELYLQKIEIFKTQLEEADRVFELTRKAIEGGVRAVDMLVAPPQYGKTGIMLALSMKLLEHGLVDVEDIYICTTHSSKMWLKQTKDRMPLSLRDRIYHRNGMRDMAELIKRRRRTHAGHVVVMVDESHIASQRGMTLDDVFKMLDIADPQSKTYVLEVTATPDGLLHDLENVPSNEGAPKVGGKVVVEARVNPDYNSFQRMLDENRIRETFDIFVKDGKTFDRARSVEALRRLVEVIVEEFVDRPRFHLVRLPVFMYGPSNRDTIRAITSEACPGLESNFYDMDSYSKCINEVFLNTEPKKHTVIYVKDMLRCSDTLNMRYVGVMFDRKCQMTSVVAQSFPGRCNGYTRHKVVCFTNVQKIEEYIRTYASGFEYTSQAWRSLTLRSNGKGVVRIEPTANRNMWGEQKTVKREAEHNVYYIVGTREEVNDSYNEHFRPLADRRTHALRWDHYLNSTKVDPKTRRYLCNGPRGKPRVYSVNEVLRDCRWGLDKESDRRVMIAYDDPHHDPPEKYKVVIFTHMVVPEWTRVVS